ncbi:MAG TPA: formate dehydrogenase accessory sulfurtransferase FdhD [Polyangiaceae bacterium]|nr:formate dehydrogenase accessory sulfurtransferase FdhD [Polyangiaceae bacterium]
MNLPSDRATRAGMRRAPIARVRSDQLERVDDVLAVEEPLEVRIGDETWATLMRTPGSDHELVVGLLLAEGIIRSALDVVRVAHCERLDPERTHNVIEVDLAADAGRAELAERRTVSSSACGVCGRTSIDDLLERVERPSTTPNFDAAWLAALPEMLARAQRNFVHTGGLHAAAIAHPERGVLALREDIGRHNAVDKAVGRLLLDRALPAHDSALVVSGRAGFEIAQKAVVAGLGALVSVSAPSSLAVETAVRSGLVLLGFARGGDYNVYSAFERLRGI